MFSRSIRTLAFANRGSKAIAPLSLGLYSSDLLAREVRVAKEMRRSAEKRPVFACRAWDLRNPIPRSFHSFVNNFDQSPQLFLIWCVINGNDLISYLNGICIAKRLF
jgi:hypothetical protein